MALIKTIEEIQEVLPKLVSSVSDITLQPNWDRVEAKYILPITGTTLYNTLVANYDAETLDANEAQLIKHLRLAIACYGYKDQLGLDLLTIGDTGYKKLANGGTTPIYGWEIQRMENTLIGMALDGVEIALAYLFENADLFPEWTGSDQYTKIKSLLIRTGAEFSNDNYTLFQPQRSFFAMRTVMADTQRLFIQETIGKDLLVYLRDKETPTADEKECILLLKKALAFFTVAKASKHFSVSFSDGGFTILGEKNNNYLDAKASQQVDLELLDMKIKECELEGGSYLELSRSELVALYNKEDAAAEFKTEFAKGPLTAFIQPEDRTSGNENRKIYSLP